MQQLAALLAAMPEAERRDALDYYEEYFLMLQAPKKRPRPSRNWKGTPQDGGKIWRGTGAQFGTPMPDNSMPEQGSRRRKSPVWIVLAILAILIVVLLVFIGSFKIVTKYQYSIAESATAEEVPRKKPPGEQPKIWTKARMKIPKQPSQRKVQKAKAPIGWKAAR